MDRTIGRPAAAGGVSEHAALRRAWPVALALTVIVLLFGTAAATSSGQTALVTSAFALDLMGPSPVQPLSWLTADPVVEDVTLESWGRSFHTTIYRPGDAKPHGVLILSMGARAWPLDSPRLVRWANDAARGGAVVMAIDSPELRADSVQAIEVEDLVQSYLYLRGQDYVDRTRMGFVGVSVGGSLALIAAADPRIASEVDYVDALGPYYDVLELLREVTTGASHGWVASEVSATVLPKQVIDHLTTGTDRTTLLRLFYQQRPVEPEKIEALSPTGRKVYDLLSNTDPARYDYLLAQLDLEDSGLLDLSPVYFIDKIQAHLLLLHSRRDHHIPISESEAIVAATQDRLGSELVPFTAFDHVDPALSAIEPALAVDSVELYSYLYRLLLRLK